MLGTRKPSLAPSLSCVFNFPAVVNSQIYSTHGAPLPFYRGCVSFSCTGYFTACVRRASELLLRGLIYPQDCLRRLFQRQVALKFSSVTLNSLGCPTSSLCSIPHLTLEEFCIRRRQMSPQVILRTSRRHCLVSTPPTLRLQELRTSHVSTSALTPLAGCSQVIFSSLESELHDHTPISPWTVTHPSTNQSRCCLTSVIKWELVFQHRYKVVDRKQQ